MNTEKSKPVCIKYPHGAKAWWVKCLNCSIKHREDGPAVEYPDGSKIWYLNGKRHREDGPAYESKDGYKEWWLNSNKYSEQDFYKKLYELGKISQDEYFLHCI